MKKMSIKPYVGVLGAVFGLAFVVNTVMTVGLI